MRALPAAGQGLVKRTKIPRPPRPRVSRRSAPRPCGPGDPCKVFRKGCKPNSVFPRCRGERAISLSDHTRDPSRNCGTRAGRSGVPYLILLPTGFSVPPRSHVARWALTPPFHPYHHGLAATVRRYVLCGTFRRRDLAIPPPERIPGLTGVARRRALRSSDFPPPAFTRSDPPPFRNAPTLGRPSESPQAPSQRLSPLQTDVHSRLGLRPTTRLEELTRPMIPASFLMLNGMDRGAVQLPV